MIRVTQPHIPDRKNFYQYLDRALDEKYLSNFGPLFDELTERLCEYFQIQNLLLVTNATLGLEMSFSLLSKPEGSAITSPFSFRATATALKRANKEIIFNDIDPVTLNWEPKAEINQKATLIAPVHIYGIPSRVTGTEEKYNVPVVYDGAHTFNSWLNGRHLLSYGDSSVISFHSTKLYHCGEGGGVAFKDESAFLEVKDRVNFGLKYSGSRPATNAKISELHCALGLSVLDEIEQILEKRHFLKTIYDEYLQRNCDGLPFTLIETSRALAYYPLLFSALEYAEIFVNEMRNQGIECRQYFDTSLNTVFSDQQCIVSESIAGRIVCLPFHTNLDKEVALLILEKTEKITRAFS